MTLCSEVNIANPSCPLVLTNFFELCMPSTSNSAFMPRLTELSNAGFSCRMATNNATRDLCMGPNGEISANLIVTICITVEKKITVPVQLCVLSTGFAEAPLQENVSGVVTCPGLFPERNDSSAAAFGPQGEQSGCSANQGCDQHRPPAPGDCDCGCSDYPPTTCC